MRFDPFAVFGLVEPMGIVSSHIGLEPTAVRHEPDLLHDDLALDSKMASLTERRDVPPSAVRLVEIKMVYGEYVSRFRIMRMPAANALPACLILHGLGDLRPVRGIFSSRRSHFMISLSILFIISSCSRMCL